MLSPDWTNPTLRPQGRGAVQSTLGKAASTMESHVQQWVPTTICTPDGVQLVAWAMPQGSDPPDAWPEHIAMARPHLDDTRHDRAPISKQHATEVADIALGGQFWPLDTDADTGKTRLVLAKFAGYSPAVPFRVHHLGGDEWQCIGGKLAQQQGGTLREFTVHTTTVNAPSGGIIGLFAGIKSNDPNAPDAHWLTGAPSFAVRTGLGALGAGTMFAALAIVTSDARCYHLSLSLPVSVQERGLITYNPSGATGTLLP